MKKYTWYLKQCNIIDDEDTITGNMEAVSLDDTIGEMLKIHIRAFAFSPNEIGCMEPMVIFTILYVSWNIKLILVPRTDIPNLN